MATPPELRSQQEALARLAMNDMAALWRQVSNAVEARTALQDVLPALVRTYGMAAASVAADWYDEARDTAEVSGSFRAIPASIADTGTDALAMWATSAGTDLDSIRVLVEGGLQKRIANWSRATVMGSALADPSADGWQRVGVGECDFCSMLIGRGAVYSEETADFGAHDHCHCAAVPAFKGAPRPVKPYKPSVRQSEADQRRAREWLAQHNGGKAGIQAAPVGGFAGLTREQLEKQLAITEGLKDSEWRTGQLKRLRDRLGEL